MTVKHNGSTVSVAGDSRITPLVAAGIEHIVDRNPVLADVMAQLDYMEKRGSGLKKICNETKALDGYREELKPVFKSSVSQFMTVLYSVEYGEGGNGELNGELNDSQKATLAFIKKHEGCREAMIRK